MSRQLTYNIAEARLQGLLAGVQINCAAGSGGRAGSKVEGAGNWWLQNNAMATAVHSGAHNFGPLPQGSYYMCPHENGKTMIRLKPFRSNYMHGRSGFLIHGRGTIGSHGCIVPYHFSDVKSVFQAVNKYISTYKAEPVLEVIAVGADVDSKFYTA
jgi:hypothetical protein